MSPDSKDIKFPTTHYIGFQTRPDEDGVPLGFMTPDGTDAAAKKRKDTVDSWARGYGYSAKNEGALPAKTLENKPMNGFKLGRSLRHGGGGWGQGNVKWRIEDPRGFELEITSPNLAQIMSCTTIENGEILEQCMWARLKSDNVLVPVSSDVYKAAQANTERAGKKASMKDIKLGDYAVMQNGDEGTYMGCYFIGRDGMGGYEIQAGGIDRKYHMFIMDPAHRKATWGDKATRVAVRMVAEPKLAEIQPCDTPLTPAEAEAKLLAHAATGGDFETAVSSYGGSPDYVVFNQGKKPAEFISRKLEPINIADFISGASTDEVLVIAKHGDYWFIVNSNQLFPTTHRWAHHGRGGDFVAAVFDMDSYNANGTFRIPTQVKNYGYYRGGSHEERVQIPVMLKDIEPQGFAVRVSGTTPLGNEISYLAQK